MSGRLAALGFGAVFGFALGWARLDDPDVIHAMLRLAEPDVFLLMGAAIATAAAGAFALRTAGTRVRLGDGAVSWRGIRPTRMHVFGSAVFGLGWCIACTCPGPIAVQLGRGEISGVFTAVGLLAGIAARDRLLAPGAETARPPAGPCDESSEALPIGL